MCNGHFNNSFPEASTNSQGERDQCKRNERIQGSFSRFSGYPGSRHRPNPTTFYSKRTVSSSHDFRGVTNPRFCAKIGVEDKEGRGVSPRGTLKRGVKRLSRIRETRAHAHTPTHTRARARLSTDIKRGQKKPRSGGCSFSRGSNTKDLSAGQPNSFGI